MIIRRRAGSETALTPAPKPRRTHGDVLHAKDREKRFFKGQKYVNVLRNRPTKEEKKVNNYLKAIGLKGRFSFQRQFLIPFHIIADFYVPELNLIIEIDGGYHKTREAEDVARDAAFLEKRGIKTIRILNASVWSGRYKEILEAEGLNKMSLNRDANAPTFASRGVR